MRAVPCHARRRAEGCTGNYLHAGRAKNRARRGMRPSLDGSKGNRQWQAQLVKGARQAECCSWGLRATGAKFVPTACTVLPRKRPAQYRSTGHTAAGHTTRHEAPADSPAGVFARASKLASKTGPHTRGIRAPAQCLERPYTVPRTPSRLPAVQRGAVSAAAFMNAMSMPSKQAGGHIIIYKPRPAERESCLRGVA